MPLDPITHAFSRPVPDLDLTGNLAGVLAEGDGLYLDTDPLAAEVYRAEAAALLPVVLHALAQP